jgi:hypothetical protein
MARCFSSGARLQNHSEATTLVVREAEGGGGLCADTRKYWYHNTFCSSSGLGIENKLNAYSASCEYNITCSYPECVCTLPCAM